MNNQTEISATELEQIALETLDSIQNGDDEKVVKLFDKVNSIFSNRKYLYTELGGKRFYLSAYKLARNELQLGS